MRIRRHFAIGIFVASLTVLMSSPAFAGGGPSPPPDITRALQAEDWPDPGFAKGKVVRVDAEAGADTPQCGREENPCRSVSQGIRRARQLQDDPVEPDEPGTAQEDLDKLINVRIAAGTYHETIEITADWLRLVGAGAGQTIVTAGPDETVIAVEEARPLWLEGMTVTGARRAIWALNSSLVIRDCEFSNMTDIALVPTGSFTQVESTIFSNNFRGVRAGGGVVILRDVTVEGTGMGIGVTGVATAIDIRSSCEPGSGLDCPGRITNHNFGVSIFRQGTLFVGAVEIEASGVGIGLFNASELTLNQATVGGGTFGVFATESSHVTVTDSVIRDSLAGIWVDLGSFLFTQAGRIENNSIFGVFFDTFGRGVIDAATVFAGNGTDVDADATSTFDIR